MNRTRPFVTTILALFMSICCTTVPEVAPPPVLTPLEVAMSTSTKEMGPAQLIEIAFALFGYEAWEAAAKVFQQALNTNELNDMGRTVAYWHTADCYEHLGRAEDAAEMYFYFATIANDILNPEPAPRNEGFIGRFDLEAKLDYAAHYINVMWVLGNAL